MKNRSNWMLKTFLSIALTSVAFCSFADADKDYGPEVYLFMNSSRFTGGSEMAETCTGKDEGNDCTVHRFNKEIKGLCYSVNGALMCKPKPPKQAYEACVDKKQGETCNLEMMEHAIAGTCQKDPGKRVELSCQMIKVIKQTPENTDSDR